MGDSTRYHIKAVSTAAAVLTAVANSREPMGSKEIAKTINIDPNAAFRQCATLSDLGFLKEEGGKFVLGMGLALFWARKKSHLEGERDKIGAALRTLEMEEGHGE